MKIVVALVLLALAGCARTQSPAPRAPERRVFDAVPERIADMPAPVPEADPSNQEQRFGIEQARARREAKPRPVGGCVDVVEGRPPPSNPCPPKGK